MAQQHTGIGSQWNTCWDGHWDGDSREWVSRWGTMWHNGDWDGDPMEQVLRGGRLGWGLMGMGRETGTRMKTEGNGC